MKENSVAGSRVSPKLLIGTILAVFFAISLLFRVGLPWDKIFEGDWVKMSSVDAYFYMRLVDNLAHNFPHLTQFDPFLLFPGGGNVGSLTFFHRLMAGSAWLIGLGSPTQHTIDVVGALFPPVLAALAIIPAYYIGKTLFNKWVGVLAASLLAVMPGEFMGRSILGGGDTPVGEILFTTTALAFLMLAIKTAGRRKMTWKSLLERDGKTVTRPLVYSLLAGIFLGMYLSTWLGGLLFVFIITLYLVLQFIANHMRQRSSEHLSIIGFITFLVALLAFLPASPTRDLTAAMIIAVITPPALYGISRLIAGRGLKPFYYPVTLVGIAIILVAALYAGAPGVFYPMLSKIRFIFFPLGFTASTTLEMQPFLVPQNSFTTQVAWGNFTTSFFLIKGTVVPGFALIAFSLITAFIVVRGRGGDRRWQDVLAWTVGALVLLMLLIMLATYRDYRYFAVVPVAALLYFAYRHADEESEPLLLFLLWTMLILTVTMIQRRFAYYLVVNISLLSAYLSWQVIWVSGIKQVSVSRAAVTGGKKHGPKDRQGWTVYHTNAGLAVIVVLVMVFSFNVVKAKEVASAALFAPSDAWQESLVWVRENTPEPLGDPEAYYELYEAPPPGQEFQYPDSAYAVTAWWDYGYWISRIAHRMPSANPSQEPARLTGVARLFLSHDDAEAQQMEQDLDSSYIVADSDTVITKFWAVVTWAGESPDKFIDTYIFPQGTKSVPIQFFYPEYYQTLVVRLYNFDGQAVPDVKPVVITYEEKKDRAGNTSRQITDVQELPSYQEALDYVASDKSLNRKIVGINPFISPVPLEAVPDYRLAFSSTSSFNNPGGGRIPQVKVFEHVP